MDTRFFLLLALVACGEARKGGPTSAGPRVTRLRGNGTPAAPGTDPEESFRFRDNRLGFDCTFLQVGDANDWRCVPNNPRHFVRFKDADCTQPVAVFTNDTCGEPRAPYATSYRPLSSDPFQKHWGLAVDLYSVGKQIARPQDLYSMTPRGCTYVVTPPGDTFALTADSGAELAHAKFEWLPGWRVQQPQIVPDDADPVANYFNGTALDTQLNEPCFFDASSQCAYYAPAVSDAFADTSCSQTVLSLNDDNRVATDSYGEKRLVTSATLQSVYYATEGTCNAATAQRYVVTLGDVVSEPTGTLSLVGTERVRESRATLDGLSFFVEHVDTQTNTPCVALATTDGKLRCIPQAIISPLIFTDSDCTNAIAIRTTSVEPKIMAYYADPCSSTLTLAKLGPQLPESNAMLYMKTPTACVEIGNLGNERFAISQIIEPSEFPEMP